MQVTLKEHSSSLEPRGAIPLLFRAAVKTLGSVHLIQTLLPLQALSGPPKSLTTLWTQNTRS